MKNLKRLRENNNLSQKELATELGINQQTYCRYEKLQTEPNFETMLRIASFFNVSLDYLCGRQFNNNIGYVPEEKKQTIHNLLELSDKQFEKADSYIQALLDTNKD